jgi:hypothetical protein
VNQSSAVRIDGSDIVHYVRSLGVRLDPWQEQVLATDQPLRLSGFHFVVRGRVDPSVYRTMEAAIRTMRRNKRNRVTRMHKAYRFKRGGGW